MNQGQIISRKTVRQKVVFAFLMAIVTTGLISLTVVFINLGLTEAFWRIWLKSWSLAFLVAVPAILIVAPLIQRFVDYLFKESIAHQTHEN